MRENLLHCKGEIPRHMRMHEMPFQRSGVSRILARRGFLRRLIFLGFSRRPPFHAVGRTSSVALPCRRASHAPRGQSPQNLALRLARRDFLFIGLPRWQPGVASPAQFPQYAGLAYLLGRNISKRLRREVGICAICVNGVTRRR